MTILIDPARTLALGKLRLENNPFFLWDNRATIGNTSSVTGVVADGSVSNALNGTTFNYALPIVSAFNSVGLRVSGVATPLSCAALASHNIGSLGATVEVSYSLNGGTTWLDCGAGAHTPADDQSIIWRFDERIAPDWRIHVTGITDGQPALGVFVIGSETILPTRIYQGYAPPLTPTNVALQSNVSEGNHLLGSAVTRQGSSLLAEFNYLDDAFVRGPDWLGFQKHFNEGRGFFWAWRPAKYGDAFYCWRQGGVMQPVNSGPKALMSVGFEARAYHE